MYTSGKFLLEPQFRELAFAYVWVDNYSEGTLCHDLVRSEDSLGVVEECKVLRILSYKLEAQCFGTINTVLSTTSVKEVMWHL